MTGGTYFTGGNGVGIAFRECGIEDVFGVEYDDAISRIARDNGFPVLTADVCDVDPASLPCVDWFHASPVCKNASNAKANGVESIEDIDTARAVEKYVEHHKPRIFSLENVWGYRKFQAFQNILDCLARNNYSVEFWHLNAADYGVPQTRKRLILVARNDGITPRKPQPTHFKSPSVMLCEKKWIGWYEAIEDLIPTLPPSQFAKWQLDRLPRELKETFSIGADEGTTKNTRSKYEPANTVTLATGSKSRAFLTNLDNASREFTVRQEDEPYPTLTASAMRRDVSTPKAFLMQVQGEGGDGIKAQAEPMQAVTANHSANKYRAFVVDGLHGGTRGTDEPFNAVVADGGSGTVAVKAFITTGGDAWSPVLSEGEPLFALTASKAEHATRAYLVNESSTMEVRGDAEPATTQIANGRNGGIGQKASVHGRVVKMTPRALARFQSFPDTYILPEKASLACTIIGNAVPPLLMQRVIEANL